jgi:RNA-binding protein YlmH
MMDYNSFIESYKGDKGRILYLIDKVKLSKKEWKTIFTDFLTPEEQHILNTICIKEDMKMKYFSDNDDAERTVGAIYSDDFEGAFPIEVLKISGNFKFEKLNHRDYLGAVLSLGIKREKIGDINIFEDGAEIFIHSDISSYIELNLNKIKNTGVKTSIIDVTKARNRSQEFRDLKINIASLRLDSVVSALENISRARACAVIKSGEVKLNYIIVYDISDKVNIGDIISIKGFGRVKIDDILGVTKKDRLSLLVKKYL